MIYLVFPQPGVPTIKLYKEDIENLEKEIYILEEAKKKKGLTVGDVMQMELAIDNKRHTIRELNAKITNGIKAGMKLTDEQKATLGNQKAQQDTEALADFLEKEEADIALILSMYPAFCFLF